MCRGSLSAKKRLDEGYVTDQTSLDHSFASRRERRGEGDDADDVDGEDTYMSVLCLFCRFLMDSSVYVEKMDRGTGRFGEKKTFDGGVFSNPR